MAGRRQDHYQVLGVTPDAPDEVIRAAYKALAAKYHPDKNPGDPDAELKLKRVNAAFRVLGDPEKRKQYDELTQSPEALDESERPAPTSAPKREAPDESPPAQPRWKMPSEGERAHTVNEQPSAGKPTSTGIRLLLACGAAGTSLLINLNSQSHSARAEANPESAFFGLLLGCGLLALFIYWLAGKIGPMVCAFVVALVAVTVVALRDNDDAKPKTADGMGVAQTVVQPTPITTAIAATTRSAPLPDPVARDERGNPLWVYDVNGTPLSMTPADAARAVAAGKAAFLREARVMIVTKSGLVTDATGDQVGYAFQRGAHIASPVEIANGMRTP